MKSARARSRQKIKFEFKASIGENSPVKAKAKLTKTKKLVIKFSIKIILLNTCNMNHDFQWATCTALWQRDSPYRNVQIINE